MHHIHIQCAADTTAAADAAAGRKYGNFTSDRIFYSPTDLNWIIARVLVFNDSDTATALTFSGNITLAPYNPAGMTCTLCS